MNVTMIGSGNLAHQLVPALQKAGHTIDQIISRNTDHAQQIAHQHNLLRFGNLNSLENTSDIYLVCVADDAIPTIAESLNLNNKILVHSSGSVPINVLENCSTNFGVFYPLQTFTKENAIDFSNVPICIEANNQHTLKTLSMLGGSISTNVQHITSEHRKSIHLAAVFACNFSNHMYTIAYSLLKKEGLSMDLLKPLIAETSTKIQYELPLKVQTGPAIRNDQEIIKQHMQMLIQEPKWAEIYTLVSENIRSTYDE